MDFNVGDKVVCVEPSGIEGRSHVIEGRVYTVKGFRKGTPDIWLEEHRMSWRSSRFRLVTPAIAEAKYLELFQ